MTLHDAEQSSLILALVKIDNDYINSAGYYQHPEVVRFTAVPGDAVVCEGCRLEMSCSILRQESAANLPQPELEWIFNGNGLTDYQVRMG